MFPYERDFFIARIKSGYLRLKHENQIYKYQLNKDLIYESEEIFINTYDECLNNNVMTEEEIYPFLIERQIWSESEEERLNKLLPDYIENAKVLMYQSFNKPESVKKQRLYLNRVKKELYNIFDVRHQFDYLSCQGAALYARWQFLVQECVTTISGEKIDWYKVNPHDILSTINQMNIEESDLRFIAKTEPWSTLWTISKGLNLFDGAVSNYTEEQKILIRWSMIYDNVREHEDCPSQELIMDDDCFDGWMILKRREQNEEKQKEDLNNKLGIHSHAQQIFFPVKNQYSSDYIAEDGSIKKTGEDPEKIFNMNNILAKSIIEQRVNSINKYGKLNVNELPDVRQNLDMEITRMQHRK